jgi:hypothetical protein
MKRRNALVLLVACVMLAGVVIADAYFVADTDITQTVTIPGSGTIKTVGVAFYWDPACTESATAIGWGLIAPGASNSTTLYCLNVGSAPVTLIMVTQNWTPANAANYIQVPWDYANQTIEPGVSNALAINFTITVSASIVGTGITTFSYDYNITATG